VEVSDLSPEEATQTLDLQNGDQIVVRPTVLGVSGSVSGLLWKQTTQEREITLDHWVANQSTSLSWSITTQVQTEESIAKQEEYETTYASSPVGTAIPPAPEPMYQDVVTQGSISSELLQDSQTLLLPEMWPEGSVGTVDQSLIWLSRSTYDQLVSTRKAEVSLGLFDESLMKVEDATGEVKSIVDDISDFVSAIMSKESSTAQQEEATTTESLLSLEANPEWGTYTLLVNGVKTSVRTVEAKNAFASYKILANEENPLILEILLTPLSQGSLELLNPDGLLEGFGGYEVIELNKQVTP